MEKMITVLVLLLASTYVCADDYVVYVRVKNVPETVKWVKHDKLFHSKNAAEQYINSNNFNGFDTKIEQIIKLDKDLDILSKKSNILTMEYQSGPATLDDVLTVVQKIDARISKMDARITNVESRFHDFEVRLTALEKGKVVPFRSPGVLTDPIAAAAAGRVVGQYNEFGQYVGPATQSTIIQPPIVASSYASTYAVPSFQQPIMQQPMMMAPMIQSYGMSAGACSSGSCSSSGRRGIIGRMFGRRGG